MSDEKDISQRYRELPREEPPRALDEAILAASRRAVDARPAPLVAPTGRRRWYFPVAAAAIIVLAVAVTVHVEREQPDAELISSRPITAPAAPVESKPPAPAAQAERPRKKAARRDQPSFVPEPKPQAAPAAPAPAPAEERKLYSQRDEMASSREAEVAGARAQRAPAMERPANVSAVAKLAEQSPEQWLQGIADLRRQGRHEEADKSLAEFRKRYPDYRLSDEMKAKVEKR